MEQLIEALQILLKYGNPTYPTHCEHDVLCVLIPPRDVSPEDRQKLNGLGFIGGDDDDYFVSFRYGSA